MSISERQAFTSPRTKFQSSTLDFEQTSPQFHHSPAASRLVTPGLITSDVTLAEREEEFLIELSNLDQETIRFKSVRAKVERRQRRIPRLSKLAASIGAYQQEEEKRTQDAKRQLGEPIPDFTSELSAVDQVKRETRDLERKIGKSPLPALLRDITRQLADVESRTDANRDRNRSLARRNADLDSQEATINEEIKDLEECEADYEDKRQKTETEAAGFLESIPENTIKEIQKANARKSDIASRNSALQAERANFEKTEQDRAAEIADLQSEIDKLLQLQDDIGRFGPSGVDQAVMNNAYDALGESLGHLEHKRELQAADLAKLDEERAELEKSQGKLEADEKELDDRISDFERRKAKLAKSENDLDDLRRELDEMRRRLAEKEKQVAEAEARAREILTKVHEAQSELDAEGTAKVELRCSLRMLDSGQYL
jgi:DNA repair exonuclease SbcCD ATPase subunit